MKSFGVGCFHFSISDSLQREISVKEYADEIVSALGQLSNVADIDISYEENLIDGQIETDPPNPRLQNGEQAYPQLPLLDLKFSIYLPYRVQVELSGFGEDRIDTYTENFLVRIKHNWHGPVTYIECKAPSEEPDPSTAVIVIRKHLEREFSGLNTFLVMDFVGPSPFHAEFYLEVVHDDEDSEERFLVDHVKKPGYNRLYFKHITKDWVSEEAALESLYRELSDELAYFYFLNVNESQRIRTWHEMYGNVREILSIEDKDSKASLKRKLLDKPALYRAAFRDIGVFKGQEISIASANESQYAEIYGSGKQQTYLREYIDKEISDAHTFPIKETLDLLSYFDSKNSKSFELSVIFFAAVIGGLVGALVTAAFK